MDGTHLRRLEPPSLDRGQVLRPRLLARLAGRWDRRATVIVGGPGFGKSTLLSQAMRENLLAPRGADHWVSLTSADNDPGVLLRGIARVLDLAVSLIDFAATTAADDLVALASSLPPGTCLVIDDLHELDPRSPGHRAFEAFLARIPLQCSLVLSSRTFPAIAMSEWMAKGAVDIINEADLRYTDDELAAALASRGRRSVDVDHGGWPALVELGAVTGLSGNEAYLREVVLSRMPEQHRRRLAVLDAIGGGDLDLLSEALGTELGPEVRGELRAFPMMQRVGERGMRPHALWQPVLSGVLAPEERSSARTRAATALLGRRRFDDALRLYATESDWDGVASVISEACRTGSTEVSFDMLDRWRRTLPHTESWRPEAKLVEGIAERASHTWSETTAVLFEDAIAKFREEGKTGAEVAALAELAFVARERGDQPRLGAIIGRLFELDALGVREVTGMLRLARAVIADSLDQNDQVLAELAPLAEGELPGQWMARAFWIQGQAALFLGDLEQSRRFAEQARDAVPDDYIGARLIVHYTDWWTAVDETTAATLPSLDNEPAASPFDRAHGGALFGALHAYVGNVDLCRLNLGIAEHALALESGNSTPRPEYIALIAGAKAALAVAEGREADGAAIFREFFDAFPITTPVGGRTARRWPGLVAVLSTPERAFVFDAAYDSVIAEARDLARWFVSLRDGRKTKPPVPQPERRLLNALPLRWAVEACARFATFQIDGARVLCEYLVRVRGSLVRSMLRSLADGTDGVSGPESDESVRTGAKRLLATVPVAPSLPLVVRVLGPLEIAWGDRVSDAPELRRERARQIVALLAVRGSIGREALTDIIWPELDRNAAQQNLRTTLNYVHKLLEPDRGPGDAPFVVRQQGDQLSLIGPPWVEVDLTWFERLLADAAESRRIGAHSAEVEQLERALSMVRGEPLPDVAYDDWAAPHLRTIRAQIVSSAQRAAELRFAGGAHETAQIHASLCIRFDPWNESANNLLVTSLLAQGRIGAARDALHAWKNVQQDLGVATSPATSMLERRIGASAAR